MNTRIVVTGQVRAIQSKGKTFHFSTIFIYKPNMPFPTECDIFGEIPLAAGEYDVPCSVGVFNARPQVEFNWGAAVLRPSK